MTTNNSLNIEQIIRSSLVSLSKIKLGPPKINTTLPEEYTKYTKYTDEQFKNLFSLQNIIRDSINNMLTLTLGEPINKSKQLITNVNSLLLQNIIKESVKNMLKFKLDAPKTQINPEIEKLAREVTEMYNNLKQLSTPNQIHTKDDVNLDKINTLMDQLKTHFKTSTSSTQEKDLLKTLIAQVESLQNQKQLIYDANNATDFGLPPGFEDINAINQNQALSSSSSASESTLTSTLADSNQPDAKEPIKSGLVDHLIRDILKESLSQFTHDDSGSEPSSQPYKPSPTKTDKPNKPSHADALKSVQNILGSQSIKDEIDFIKDCEHFKKHKTADGQIVNPTLEEYFYSNIWNAVVKNEGWTDADTELKTKLLNDFKQSMDGDKVFAMELYVNSKNENPSGANNIKHKLLNYNPPSGVNSLKYDSKLDSFHSPLLNTDDDEEIEDIDAFLDQKMREYNNNDSYKKLINDVKQLINANPNITLPTGDDKLDELIHQIKSDTAEIDNLKAQIKKNNENKNSLPDSAASVSDNQPELEKKLAELTKQLDDHLKGFEPYPVSVGDKTDHNLRTGLGKEIKDYADFIKRKYINPKPEDLKQSDSIIESDTESIASLIERLEKGDDNNNVSSDNGNGPLTPINNGDEKSLYDLIYAAIDPFETKKMLDENKDNYKIYIKDILTKLTLDKINKEYDENVENQLLSIGFLTTSPISVDADEKYQFVYESLSTIYLKLYKKIDNNLASKKMSQLLSNIGQLFNATFTKLPKSDDAEEVDDDEDDADF
jgi:hypothetical protein